MSAKLTEAKKSYYGQLDRKARYIAHKLAEGEFVSLSLLESVEDLYISAHSQEFYQEFFRVRYHTPISSDLEFLIARVLHHYSVLGDLDWAVYLRCQKGKTALDIRIEHNGKTLAIIEIKAKAGWIQPFFSSERAMKDMAKLQDGKSDFNPDDLIKRVKDQFRKYYETYGITPGQVFVLLPSLALVHRKKFARTRW